jgi:hypothetical protein
MIAFPGAECSGYATSLLPDVEPADERDCDRRLETANSERKSSGYSALGFYPGFNLIN